MNKFFKALDNFVAYVENPSLSIKTLAQAKAFLEKHADSGLVTGPPIVEDIENFYNLSKGEKVVKVVEDDDDDDDVVDDVDVDVDMVDDDDVVDVEGIAEEVVEGVGISDEDIKDIVGNDEEELV